MTWGFANGSLKSTVTSNGYAYLKQGLLDVSNKDVVIEFDITPRTWGGVSFRGINCDLNGTRIGWRDSATKWYPKMSAGVKHHVLLIIQKNTPYNLSHLYVDESLIFSNEPLEVNSFPDKTVGFLSNYNPGSNLYDNMSVVALNPGTHFAPILNPIGNKSVALDATLTFQAQAFDPNNDAITYTATGLPPGANIDFNTGTFTWTPQTSDQGTHTIVIEASDGSLSDTETINITVS